jgi:ubiquinone/menaquinone biosynthesis C-methylase UbiE
MKEWEKFGKRDPYYSVLNDNRFRLQGGNQKEKLMEELFISGERHVEKIFDVIEKHFGNELKYERALDYGAGVGRVVLPLAKKFTQVVAADCSRSMLDEARKNCEARGLSNVFYAHTQETGEPFPLDQKYDFIHSYAVFLHIPVKDGEVIFSKMLNSLNAGGTAAVQFSYATTRPVMRLYSLISEYVPLVYNLQNLLKGRSFFYPQMHMNYYNLNRIFKIVQENQCSIFDVRFVDHAGRLSVMLLLNK